MSLRHGKNKWLEAAVALQDLQQQFNLNFAIPRFAIIGKQSAGKTRMLSVFAGRKLGGAEQDCTGTRCPVIYRFQLSPSGDENCEITIGNKRESVNVCDIHDKIGAHMSALAAGVRFSNDPIHVKLTGKSCLNAVVVDLPGLKPDPNAPENPVISSMIKTFASPSETIPLVMSGFTERLDLEYVHTELKSLLNCCENWQAVAKRSVVFASRLDAVRQSVDKAKIQEFVTTVESLGFRKENVVFFSLCPEMLDGHSGQMFKGESPSYKQLSTYFSETLYEKEKQYLPQFLTKLSIKDYEYQFGVSKAMRCVESLLEETLRENIGKAHVRMRGTWEKLKLDDQLFRKVANDSYLKEMVRSYVSLVVEVLSGTATADSTRIFENFRVSKEKFPEFVDMSDEEFASRLIKELSKTFREEQKVVDPAFNRELTLNFDKNFYRQLETPCASGELHDLAKNRRRRLGGATAVGRIISLFGFSVMTSRLREFTADEVVNMGSFCDLNGSRGFNTSLALRKMVNEIRTTATSYENLIKYCAWLFSSQATVVCAELRTKVWMLKQFPALNDFIDRLIVTSYGRWFEERAKRTALKAQNVLKVRSETLKIDELTATIRLLSCLNTDGSGLLEMPQLVQKKPEAKNEAGGPKVASGHSFNFSNMLSKLTTSGGSSRPHDFASLEGLKVVNMNQDQVESNLHKLNETAHMIGRFGSGNVFYEIVMLIEAELVRPAQQLSHDIRSFVMDSVLRRVESPEFLRLKNQDLAQVETRERSLAKLELYIEAVKSLNPCCKDAHLKPLGTKKPLEMVAALKKDIALAKQKQEEAVGQENIDEPDWDESDEDE